MKFNLILAAALTIGTAGLALAQTPAPAPAPGGNGGGRGALAAACSADIQTNCAGQSGRGIRQCLTQNESKLSAGCKSALASLPARGGAGGGAAPAGQ